MLFMVFLENGEYRDSGQIFFFLNAHNIFYLSPRARAHIILKHHTVQFLCGHGIAEVCEEVTGVGVVDQHGHRANHHGQVDKVLPAETTPDLRLVAGAAEHHRHVDGRVEQERPGQQGQRGGGEEEEEEEGEGR